MAQPVIPHDGLEGFMDIIIPAIANGQNGGLVQLYSNDYVPDVNSLPANFTFPPFGGYAALPTPNAVNKGFDAGGHNIWQFDLVNFLFSGAGLPGVIYGWFLTYEDAVSLTTRVLWAQRFDNPIAVVAAGQAIPFIPTLGDIQAA